MNAMKVVSGLLPFLAGNAPGLAVACALLSGCETARVPPAAEAPEVTLVRARQATADYTLILPARAQAGQTAQVYARATGLVGERRADLGDRVRAGQVLATIVAPEIDQAVRAAQAQAAQAEANLALARGNYARAAAMVRTQLISREDYSNRLGARDAAQAALDAARAELASARAAALRQRARAVRRRGQRAQHRARRSRGRRRRRHGADVPH